jgi:hypothetical protein
MPIMLESALTSNVFIVSQMLFNRFPENFFIRLLGVWEVCYFVRPSPRSSLISVLLS